VLHAIFNYILKLLYLGCQWEELPIRTGKDGRPEIHYSRIYRMFRYWEKHGCIDAIFTAVGFGSSSGRPAGHERGAWRWHDHGGQERRGQPGL